ncbi:MAG: UDP-N-acetylmuramoyl-L-alanyl-D-glutamate--2,6-diaminopimelate ligase [Synergistaceae bacterium]|jgi:UDP-N-acetylmuramoyl-L-alanyl-D-glutamate--2,6-diaminopimelate ligase|nr:UDP-N-acetylmuramoyl-L-alanyl-D-glutamate--2,6-diaminopimelate ligase [Synergistaceae bacterium]
MKFSSLVEVLRQKGFDFAVNHGGGAPAGERDPSIFEVFADSRRVLPGSIFCCIRGEKSDGHEYAGIAKELGAVALVCEYPLETDLPVIVVKSVRDIMGDLAAAVYGYPAEKLLMAGVTGTNGKSTTTYALRSILHAAGFRTGLTGTIVESDGVRERDAERTTPESCEIQRLLAATVKNGCGACVMETSSHGLMIGRLNGCRFDVGVFTNLNPEHLDFHGDMENYFQAKRLLFTKYMKDNSVLAINTDDPWGSRLLKEFSCSRNPSEPGAGQVPSVAGFGFADVGDMKLDMEGSAFTVRMKNFPPLPIKSPLAGRYNVANVLATVAALRGRISDSDIARGVADIPQVPGRLEKRRMSNGATCIIDFAHTPEALRNTLTAVRDFCPGRLISIFGHGGGRYESNRPALGAVAASLADMIIVTMDNPRDEDPLAIAEAIVRGIVERGGGARYKVIPDRREAIFTALSIAGPGDVLLVSGKGPEKFLTIRDQKIPYSDAEAIEEWEKLANSRASRPFRAR